MHRQQKSIRLGHLGSLKAMTPKGPTPILVSYPSGLGQMESSDSKLQVAGEDSSICPQRSPQCSPQALHALPPG